MEGGALGEEEIQLHLEDNRLEWVLLAFQTTHGKTVFQ